MDNGILAVTGKKSVLFSDRVKYYLLRVKIRLSRTFCIYAITDRLGFSRGKTNIFIASLKYNKKTVAQSSYSPTERCSVEGAYAPYMLACFSTPLTSRIKHTRTREKSLAPHPLFVSLTVIIILSFLFFFSPQRNALRKLEFKYSKHTNQLVTLPGRTFRKLITLNCYYPQRPTCLIFV